MLSSIRQVSTGAKLAVAIGITALATAALTFALTYNLVGNKTPVVATNNSALAGNQSLGSEVDTSDWVTYRNEKYGIEFKHPAGAKIKELSGEELNGMQFGVWVYNHPESYFEEIGYSYQSGEYLVAVDVDKLNGNLECQKYEVSEEYPYYIKSEAVKAGQLDGFLTITNPQGDQPSIANNVCAGSTSVVLSVTVYAEESSLRDAISDSVRFTKNI